MSSVTALLVVLGLFVVAFIPLALAAAKVTGWVPVTIFNGALILGAAGYQAGLFAPHYLQQPELPESQVGSVSNSQCAELMTALEQAGVIVDRRTPPHLIVDRAGWAQLPEEASGIILDCVQRAWPAGSAAPELEIRAR